MDALNRQAVRVLHAIGNTNVRHISTTVGPEQEYFLVDKAYFDKRTDLLLTGRTVFGNVPPKGQELDDQYFGAIKERVAAFMRELNTELWKIGIPAKTQHNEVAPNQFEIAPIYSSTSQAVDQNQMVMELIHNIALRHGMRALLHEKPFAGVNGSGKHNNWAIATDDGVNLFDPGADPASNARFLLFTAAVIEAVDRYALLLRSSVASSGNEHRLGANEAPPAIVSIFFGDVLTGIFEDIAAGKESAHSAKAGRIELGVTSLPKLPKDVSDRNRTSPFAFTGNKFEFRMVGSSQSIANPNTYLNVAVAQVLSEFADKLEAQGGDNKAIEAVIRESYSAHKRVVFNGNGYSDDWVKEAAARGLPNVVSTPDALAVLVEPATIKLFQDHKVLSPDEMESRYNIYLENYSKQLHIEARVVLDMARRQVFPAVSNFAADLARDAAALTAVGADAKPQESRARQIATLCSGLFDEAASLENVLNEAEATTDVVAQAKAYNGPVRNGMAAVRDKVDTLQRLVSKSEWPYPDYEDLLFRL
jgi:glutamine synthetase